MNIHEYQAKALLHEFGVPISRGVPVLKASDSDAAARSSFPARLAGEEPDPCLAAAAKGKFKESFSAGDKGGVRIAKSVAEVNEFAKQMLGATLVTIFRAHRANRSTGSTFQGRLRHPPPPPPPPLSIAETSEVFSWFRINPG